MTDEWKAPESEPEEREERKSWKLLEKTLLAGVQGSVVRGAGGFSSSC